MKYEVIATLTHSDGTETKQIDDLYITDAIPSVIETGVIETGSSEYTPKQYIDSACKACVLFSKKVNKELDNIDPNETKWDVQPAENNIYTFTKPGHIESIGFSIINSHSNIEDKTSNHTKYYPLIDGDYITKEDKETYTRIMIIPYSEAVIYYDKITKTFGINGWNDEIKELKTERFPIFSDKLLEQLEDTVHTKYNKSIQDYKFYYGNVETTLGEAGVTLNSKKIIGSPYNIKTRAVVDENNFYFYTPITNYSYTLLNTEYSKMISYTSVNGYVSIAELAGFSELDTGEVFNTNDVDIYYIDDTFYTDKNIVIKIENKIYLSVVDRKTKEIKEVELSDFDGSKFTITIDKDTFNNYFADYVFDEYMQLHEYIDEYIFNNYDLPADIVAFCLRNNKLFFNIKSNIGEDIYSVDIDNIENIASVDNMTTTAEDVRLSNLENKVNKMFINADEYNAENWNVSKGYLRWKGTNGLNTFDDAVTAIAHFNIDIEEGDTLTITISAKEVSE